MASFVDENDTIPDETGIAANNDLSARLLQKLEFNSMMRQQFNPVNDPEYQDEAKFVYAS